MAIPHVPVGLFLKIWSWLRDAFAAPTNIRKLLDIVKAERQSRKPLINLTCVDGDWVDADGRQHCAKCWQKERIALPIHLLERTRIGPVFGCTVCGYRFFEQSERKADSYMRPPAPVRLASDELNLMLNDRRS